MAILLTVDLAMRGIDMTAIYSQQRGRDIGDG